MFIVQRSSFIVRPRRGFTLVEVLATLLLVAIVLPALMQGMTLASRAALGAKRRTEAAGLAESKLAEIVATNAWQGGTLGGDFAPDQPDYHWQAAVANWSGDDTTQSVQQIDLKVIWLNRGREDSVTLSTLAYVKATSTSSTTTGQ